MTTTILQSVVARCRQNFTTTSATAVLVDGTQRRLTVTAGSYVDLRASVACAVGAAADTFLNIYVDGAIAGEGGSGSVGTAADFLQMVARARVGPITAAQAAAGILVDLRVATSADTLSITAATTPTKYSAVLEATEMTISDLATNLPKQIPHLLLWLKADTGITRDPTSNDVTAWAATTITSGKALMRWRYNLGTTTGAAGVNGVAEVADTSFAPADPGTIFWGTIGSPSAGDFPIGDFRLSELLVYSLAQASTEDAVSSSDIQAIRDYLNAKYLVY